MRTLLDNLLPDRTNIIITYWLLVKLMAALLCQIRSCLQRDQSHDEILIAAQRASTLIRHVKPHDDPAKQLNGIDRF
jgi:hypothetical protein